MIENPDISRTKFEFFFANLPILFFNICQLGNFKLWCFPICLSLHAHYSKCRKFCNWEFCLVVHPCINYLLWSPSKIWSLVLQLHSNQIIKMMKIALSYYLYFISKFFIISILWGDLLVKEFQFFSLPLN